MNRMILEGEAYFVPENLEIPYAIKIGDQFIKIRDVDSKQERVMIENIRIILEPVIEPKPKLDQYMIVSNEVPNSINISFAIIDEDNGYCD